MPVTIDKTEDVWTIIHDRPDASNAMDPDHAQALFDAFEAFDTGPAKVAVLWEGTSGAARFMSGAGRHGDFQNI